jgi:hypothetical protein
MPITLGADGPGPASPRAAGRQRGPGATTSRRRSASGKARRAAPPQAKGVPLKTPDPCGASVTAWLHGKTRARARTCGARRECGAIQGPPHRHGHTAEPKRATELTTARKRKASSVQLSSGVVAAPFGRGKLCGYGRTRRRSLRDSPQVRQRSGMTPERPSGCGGSRPVLLSRVGYCVANVRARRGRCGNGLRND